VRARDQFFFHGAAAGDARARASPPLDWRRVVASSSSSSSSSPRSATVAATLTGTPLAQR
jgi:hypothetical protein